MGRVKRDGLFDKVSDRDVRVAAQLRRAGVVSLEIGELRMTFEPEGASESDNAAPSTPPHSVSVGLAPSHASVDDDEPSAYDATGMIVVAAGGNSDAH